MESGSVFGDYPVYKRHKTSVIYRRRARDFFQKSYWLFCRNCDWEEGPFPSKSDAHKKSNQINLGYIHLYCPMTSELPEIT